MLAHVNGSSSSCVKMGPDAVPRFRMYFDKTCAGQQTSCVAEIVNDAACQRRMK